MNEQERFRIDRIYREKSLEDIPWNCETPPQLLVELVDTGKIKPCKAIDLGCGAGNYALYLASRGFDVTGVDFAPAAIRIATQNAESRGLKCSFLVADVVEELTRLKQSWDLAYDWGLLHHIFPDKRHKYIAGVRRILNPQAKYLSVSFSEKDTAFGSRAKFRKTSHGTTLYFSSKDELVQLFQPYFVILDFQTLEISGKFDSHIFNYAFMQRKPNPKGKNCRRND